jgi:hypothetical protein
MRIYNYKNCQSLFGYSADVHIRSGGRCQLCGCGGEPLNFDLWRQMTVEHLIGKSQGGYLKQVQAAVAERFAGLTFAEQNNISQRIDSLNTVTACSFCNSTTSRDASEKTMGQLLYAVQGGPDEVLAYIATELQLVLERKRRDVAWKLIAIRKAFESEVAGKIDRVKS